MQEIDLLLGSFDGHDVAPLRSAMELATDRPEAALPHLLGVSDDPDPRIQEGATWVVKALAEADTPFDRDATTCVIALLATGQVLSPNATLHLLQTLPWLSLPRRERGRLHRAILVHLDASHTFVRAWAYNALGVLAAAFPEHAEEASRRFEAAMRSEKASVKARIRNVMAGRTRAR